MNYLLFNNEIFISDGKNVSKVDQEASFKETLESIEKIRLCYVDVDVMIASAPEDYLDKKDSILVQKFQDLYSHEYITLNEKIDSNVFQVIGIKAEKVKKVYGLIPSSKVEAFMPYAMSVRSFLVNKTIDMTKPIVFVDDLSQEKLITVFDGLKFSRTRTVYTDRAEDMLPDIKRSYIDFNKKLGEFASKSVTGDFTIVTNNKQMAADIQLLESAFSVEFVDCCYPALEGLKFTENQIKYRIHEEIMLERKQKEMHSKFMYFMMATIICLAGTVFYGYQKMAYAFVMRDLEDVKNKNFKLELRLDHIDQQIYQDSLKHSKSFNYASAFFELSELLPSSYEIASFDFIEHQGRWIFDTYLFSQDDQFYDEIPKIRILKKAEIKDLFIKNRPGKYLKIDL